MGYKYQGNDGWLTKEARLSLTINAATKQNIATSFSRLPTGTQHSIVSKNYLYKTSSIRTSSKYRNHRWERCIRHVLWLDWSMSHLLTWRSWFCDICCSQLSGRLTQFWGAIYIKIYIYTIYMAAMGIFINACHLGHIIVLQLRHECQIKMQNYLWHGSMILVLPWGM